MDERTLSAVRTLHALFREKGHTLSLAESCTGGLISHYVTALPGASVFFRAGIIAYSAEAKRKILGISYDVISEYGMVSGETAKQMAEKVRGLMETDFALSTTGNLGPEVLEGKEKGLVYVAVSKEGMSVSRQFRLHGDRAKNKEDAALAALRFLLEIAGG